MVGGKMRFRGFAISLVGVIIIAVWGGRSQYAYAQSGEWAPVASMSTPRYFLAAAVGRDVRIYVLGGYNYVDHSFLSTVEVYDPETSAWSFVASMPTARSSLAATTGPDGRIYAIGGFAPNGNSL